MENNENLTQDAEVVSQSSTEEQKEVLAAPYQQIFENIFEFSKTLGQVVFVDNNQIEDGTSNTISIIRMLSSGEKQFYKITVEETKEILIKK